MYLLDTNIVSELRRNRPHEAVLAWLQRIPEGDLYLSAVTIGEIQAGIETTREQDPAKAREVEAWLDRIEATYAVLPMEGRVFRCWAKLMHRQTDDLLEDAMIAATAMTHRLTVATRNVKDFTRFGVAVCNPFVTERS